MANTNAGRKFYICSTPQNADLDAAAFAALAWILVGKVGSAGQTGLNTNILTYNTWDTDVAQKSKGVSDAGSPDIEVARVPTDAGQVAMRAAAATNLNYAFRMVTNDPATDGGTGTTIYNRGIVTGPKRPNGKVEDFDLEIFTLGLQQKEIVVDPT